MSTTTIPPSVHRVNHSEASSSTSSSSSTIAPDPHSLPEVATTAARGILRTRSRHPVIGHPPSPLLKRALERTVSIHTSMGKIAKAPVPKRSIALAPSGPSAAARRMSIQQSPILKKSLVPLNGSSSNNLTPINLNGSATLVITAPGSPKLNRTKSSRMEKVVGFDLSSRELLKARKLAQKGFEEKTGKSWTLTRNKSQMELDLYEQEVRKHEARLVVKKQEELDKEQTTQSNIDSRYAQIAAYQAQLAEKEAEIERNKDVVEQSKKDIENAIKDSVMKGSAVTDEKSSDVRMRLERQKKEIKRQMLVAHEVNDPRRKVLQTQHEAEELRTVISLLKKEIAKIKHDASFEKSSKARMKAAKKAQEEEKASGVVKTYAPIKPKAAKPVVPKSHMARMEAEKQRKAAKRGEVSGLRSSGGIKGSRTLALRTSGMIRQSSGLRSSTVNRSAGSSSSSSSSSRTAH